MSSVFSLKITISVFSGFFKGLGTPSKYWIGLKHTNKSSFWRMATFKDRMPPPTGVARGPLIETMYVSNASSVSSGRK